MTSSIGPDARILVVDDDEEELRLCAEALRETTKTPIVREKKSTAAARRLGAESFDLLVTDLRMPAVDGVDLLRIAHSHDAELPVVILTGYPSVDTAVEALKLGAADYLNKPVNVDELVTVAKRLLEQRQLRGEHRLLQRQIDRPYAFDEILGMSAAMEKVFDTIKRLSETDIDVLIIGETGTGKELVARAIHKRSRVCQGRFVPVDCAAIPGDLLESELFGHERGAFSGAHSRSMGLMEFADAGSFFLDEINALPLPLQAKLLRALQERKFRRLGATHETAVNLRVMAAANRDPAELVEEGHFREDLYFRLNVGRIELPALRDRPDDITMLAEHFVRRYAHEMAKPALELSVDTLEILKAYRWPGNVRELQNTIKRVLAMSQNETLTPDDLPEAIVTEAGKHETTAPTAFFELRAERMAVFEKDYISGLLRSFKGDVTSAARQAQMPRGTFYRLMKKHNLFSKQFRSTS